MRLVRLKPNAMAALPNTGGALCSMPQSFADAHYYSAEGSCSTKSLSFDFFLFHFQLFSDDLPWVSGKTLL